MTERVAIGDAVLYRGDCLELLADIEAGVILTDPVWPNCPPGLLPGSDDPHGLWRAAMLRVPSLYRLVAVLRADSDPRFLTPVPERLRFFRSIHLPYALPSFLGRVLGGDEIAYWFGTPVEAVRGRKLVPGRAPVMQPATRPANGHPCSRTQGHFDWLVNWCSDPADVVCDPFMGSGTTGVACVKLGRRFVGIEIEPRWFDLACRRIEQAERQDDLFVPRRLGPERVPASLI